jgi:uncharacterized damage-inducible protein DinB
MKQPPSNLAAGFLDQSQHSLRDHHLPRILSCLALLSPKQVWWRGNEASNSIGNLALHLEGNVRQWIVSGLGGAPDRRARDKEFAERGPLPRRRLEAKLRKTVREACRVLSRLTPRDLARRYSIQKFSVTGFEAVSHVTEHFAFHTGQILFATKLILGRDLGLTRLPGEKAPNSGGKKLPVL